MGGGYDLTRAAQTLGERLVRHRTRLGWTQKRLAEALEVNATPLGAWEAARKLPWGHFAARVEALLREDTEENGR